MPTARAGYSILSGKLPFSVVPGNHDYDSVWSDARWPATADAASPLRYGMLHYGGLDNFRSVFGSDSDFFKGKPWYVGAFNGGADSAQIFAAGGYRFLHIRSAESRVRKTSVSPCRSRGSPYNKKK